MKKVRSPVLGATVVQRSYPQDRNLSYSYNYIPKTKTCWKIKKRKMFHFIQRHKYQALKLRNWFFGSESYVREETLSANTSGVVIAWLILMDKRYYAALGWVCTGSVPGQWELVLINGWSITVKYDKTNHHCCNDRLFLSSSSNNLYS